MEARKKGLLFFLFIIFSLLIGLFLSVKKELPKREGVGVVYIYGPLEIQPSLGWIGSYRSTDYFVKRLKRIEKEPSIKAVVLRIDSPGGKVGAVQEVYKAVSSLKKKKKVVASLGDIATSGAYYIASGCSYIVANPGTLLGSIGAIFSSVDASSLLEKAGVRPRVIKSGKYKDIGSSLRPMEKEEEILLRSLIDDVHSQFVDAVYKGRKGKISLKELKELSDGRLFTGREAKEKGLVDSLGGLEESLRIAGKMAGIPGEPIIIDERPKYERLFSYIGETLFPLRDMPKLEYRLR